MNFTQVIYYADKPIIITDDTTAYKAQHPSTASYKKYNGFSAAVLAGALQTLNDIESQGVLIEETAENALHNHMQDYYTVIKAGGGVTYNEHNDILMIFRRGKWDLPKGKLDKGETIEECAVREVMEETGLTEVTLGDKIGETWHIYQEKDKNLVKHTTWFKMKTSVSQKLTPQAEEDILEIEWVNTGKLQPFVANTYHAIKDVLKKEGFSW